MIGAIINIPNDPRVTTIANNPGRIGVKRLVATLVVLAVLTTAASAQEWPSRPVRIINTFAPGGAADQLARIAADHLSTAFKQQFFVENRAGAAGVIGMQAVAAAEPDGYTFGINTLSLSVIIPMTQSQGRLRSGQGPDAGRLSGRHADRPGRQPEE
jgi:hypothetical protein